MFKTCPEIYKEKQLKTIISCCVGLVTLMGGPSLVSAAISPQMLAKQTAAMTQNSNARVVGTTIYVPTTTRFDNKAPSYSAAYQKTVNDSLARGNSMAVSQSLAQNGPSYTSLNKGSLNSPAATKPQVCSNSQYYEPKTRKWVATQICR